MQFSPDQLTLRVAREADPAVFDFAAYEDFIEANTEGRPYHVHAVQAALGLFAGRRYADTQELARETYASSSPLQQLYADADALMARLPFPDRLACSLDMATGTGKSFAMYRVARIMLNEGLVDRVLVLCPSLTIEAGLREKFTELNEDGALAGLLPARSGIRVPNIIDARDTVKVGDICIENIHATFERTGSSIRDSFAGNGARTLVISDEAHHIYSPEGRDLKRWYEFLADPQYGFRYLLGVSGTCYVGDEYFTDVVFRYGIRDAINDRWVKEVFYLKEDDSATDHERFLKLRAQHEDNRAKFAIKPLTIAVTKNIAAAKRLGEDLVQFLAGELGDAATAASQVLVVTSAAEHVANVAKLALVDDASSPVEWIVSVAMLSEGWDVKNVFQVYPHERRAFNSKLLIAQVLGRGLRRPAGVADPVLHVFNHANWGKGITELVAEVLDTDTTVYQRPAERAGVPHFQVHQLDYETTPGFIEPESRPAPKPLNELTLRPQLDADKHTVFADAKDASREKVLRAPIANRRLPVERVVAEVRHKLLAFDDAYPDATLATDYPRGRIEKMIVDALERLHEDPDEVSEENRQVILASFGQLCRRSSRRSAVLETQAGKMGLVSTSSLPVIVGRTPELTDRLSLFYDEQTDALSSADDRAAIEKVLDSDRPAFMQELAAGRLRSPVNLVLATYTPERRFVKELVRPENAACLRSWVKAPNTTWYGIEFAYARVSGGKLRRKVFHPDFFLLLDAQDLVLVVETKMDEDPEVALNAGKLDYATKHFARINELLEDAGESRRYRFDFLSPRDYSRYFTALRGGKLAQRAGAPDGFVSTLQGSLKAPQTAEDLA